MKTMFFPSRAARINPRSAAVPPRVDDPRTFSTPYWPNVRALVSPSRDCELITTIGRRKRECSIITRCRCQKEMMYCGRLVRFPA